MPIEARFSRAQHARALFQRVGHAAALFVRSQLVEVEPLLATVSLAFRAKAAGRRRAGGGEKAAVLLVNRVHVRRRGAGRAALAAAGAILAHVARRGRPRLEIGIRAKASPTSILRAWTSRVAIGVKASIHETRTRRAAERVLVGINAKASTHARRRGTERIVVLALERALAHVRRRGRPHLQLAVQAKASPANTIRAWSSRVTVGVRIRTRGAVRRASTGRAVVTTLLRVGAHVKRLSVHRMIQGAGSRALAHVARRGRGRLQVAITARAKPTHTLRAWSSRISIAALGKARGPVGRHSTERAVLAVLPAALGHARRRALQRLSEGPLAAGLSHARRRGQPALAMAVWAKGSPSSILRSGRLTISVNVQARARGPVTRRGAERGLVPVIMSALGHSRRCAAERMNLVSVSSALVNVVRRGDPRVAFGISAKGTPSSIQRAAHGKLQVLAGGSIAASGTSLVDDSGYSLVDDQGNILAPNFSPPPTTTAIRRAAQRLQAAFSLVAKTELLRSGISRAKIETRFSANTHALRRSPESLVLAEISKAVAHPFRKAAPRSQVAVSMAANFEVLSSLVDGAANILTDSSGNTLITSS